MPHFRRFEKPRTLVVWFLLLCVGWLGFGSLGVDWLGVDWLGVDWLGVDWLGRAAAAEEAEPPAAPIAIADVQHEGPVDFEKEILPILRTHCMACHSSTEAEADLILESPQTILKGSIDGAVVVAKNSAESRLLQLAAHLEEPFMPPPDNEVQAAALSPEQLGLIKLWIDQGATGTVSASPVPLTWQRLPARVRPIYAVALSPDGQLAACGRGNRIEVYETASGKHLATLSDPALSGSEIYPDQPVAHLDLVQSLAFSPDGARLASGAFRTVKIWRRTVPAAPAAAAAESETPQEPPAADVQAAPDAWQWERTIGQAGDPSVLAGRVTALAFSPNGELLGTGGGQPSRAGELKIFSTADGSLVREITDAHSDTIFALQFSPDGSHLATGAADRFVKVFQVADGVRVKSLEGHTHHVLGVSWKADGKLLASSGADNVVKIWEFESGEQKRTIGGFSKEVTSVAFIAESGELVAAAGDAQLRRLKSDDGGQVRKYEGSEGFLQSAAVSRDGRLVAAGNDSGTLRAWQVEDGKLLPEFTPPAEPAKEVAGP